MKVLVIDVGGTHVKVRATGQKTHIEISSGPGMTARKMVAAVRKIVAGWKYEAITMGYPGPVLHGHIVGEPHNLGKGWVKFNFQKAFGCPVRIINDAAMQALGSYEGRRMLFLGLGTGLGSAMIVDGMLEPMELAHLPYKKGRTYEDYVGLAGLKRLGKRNGGAMSMMSSNCSRRHWKLIMSCWAAAMRNCSRSFRPEAGSETTPMRFVAACAFGQKPTFTISKNESLWKLRCLWCSRH